MGCSNEVYVSTYKKDWLDPKGFLNIGMTNHLELVYENYFETEICQKEIETPFQLYEKLQLWRSLCH